MNKLPKTYRIRLYDSRPEIKPRHIFKVHDRYFGINNYNNGWAVTDILTGLSTGSRLKAETAAQAFADGPAFMEENWDRVQWNELEIINPEWLL